LEIKFIKNFGTFVESIRKKCIAEDTTYSLKNPGGAVLILVTTVGKLFEV
jgi:hypothetical protein